MRTIDLATLSQRVLTVFIITVFAFYQIVLSQVDIGIPKITNYSYLDYDAASVNWWITEDKEGILYFANSAGVLTYDGEDWEVIPLSNGSNVRCLAQDASGIVYAGGISELGYLKTDNIGHKTFVSLLPEIPEEHRNFADVWEVDYWNDLIVFRVNRKLFLWNGNDMKVVESNNDLHVGKVIGDKYYVRIWNRGLCTFDGEKFTEVPNGGKFADKRIYSMLYYDEKNILIGTRSDGFFLYDGVDFTPFKTEIDDIVKDNLYLPGLRIDNDRFLLNTFSKGAYLINSSGVLLQSFNSESGLQDNAVDYVHLDKKGNLWFALFNGISKTYLNSKFTYLDKSMGLESNVVFDIIKKDEYLYISTNNGCYYLKDGENTFQFIEGTDGQGGAIVEIKGHIYTGTGSAGMFELVDGKMELVRGNYNYDFRSRFFLPDKTDPNRVFAAHERGIRSFYYNERTEKLEEESSITGLITTAFGLEMDEKGRLWAEAQQLGTVKKVDLALVDGRLDFSQSNITIYDTSHGLPEATINFWDLDGEIQFFGNNEGFLYNEEEDIFEPFTPPYDASQINSTIGAKPVKDSRGNIVLNAGGGVTIGQKSSEGIYSYDAKALKEIKNRKVWSIRFQEVPGQANDITWFAGPDGIIRFDGNLEELINPPFEVLVRSLKINNDSLLYAGVRPFDQNVDISHKDDIVSFSYASPFFLEQEYITYSTQLEGLNSEWSPWSKQNYREYINLPHGDYVFKVKAKNLFDEESNIAEFDFTIRTPWYMTLWAYILYVLAGLGLIYGIVKSRTRILRERQKELEMAVDARTKEVRKRLEELDTVNKVSQVVSEKLDMDELIHLVGDQMKKVFNANITYLAIHDPETNIINFPYQDGDNMQPLKYGEGLTSKIIQTGEPLLINKGIDDRYQNLGIKRVGKNASSYLGVPIPVEDKVVGVLSVQSTELENRFTENDLRLLNTIARSIGIAYHNAELFEQTKLAKAQAEDANEAKSSFLSTVSHELRTPLTSVLGFAKIIRKRLEDKIFPAVNIEDQKIKKTMKQISDNLDVVVAEGERLTNLINDVLDLAKIESGNMDWVMKPLYLQDVIQRAISATTSLFDSKKLKLERSIPSDLPIINGDQDKLIQVMINLLSNAVKFTEKGKVTVTANEENGQIKVSIHDTGIGIADEDKIKVFERFRQAGDTLTDKPQGTGLGLPICKEIIEKHGGGLALESEYGIGSTFYFFLPVLGDVRARPMEIDHLVKSLKQQIGNPSLIDKKDISRVLVVDDDSPIRSLLKQELTHEGYEVDEAPNGKVALDLVRTRKPDLIILDVMMPEINGFDVAAVLKNDPDTMDIPIIILSIVEDKERGYRIGVDRYLTKPIDTQQLFTEIDTLIEQGVSKKKVMVIDEDLSTVETLSSVLKQRGYNVIEPNGKDLVQHALDARPDIIMLNSYYKDDPQFLKQLKFKDGMENVLFFIYQ